MTTSFKIYSETGFSKTWKPLWCTFQIVHEPGKGTFVSIIWKRLWGRGGVSYPEFQILQLRRYLWHICTFLMVWGTFHLPLINQCKTQTSCSSKKRRKYLQNISFFFCNVCNLRLKASVAVFLIVFPTAALEAPFSIYL